MPTHLVGVLEFKVDHALANGVEAVELLRAPVCGRRVWKKCGAGRGDNARGQVKARRANWYQLWDA